MYRYKNAIFLTLLSISTVVCFLVWRVGYVTEERKGRSSVVKADEKQYMQFDHWLNGTFSARSLYPNWISDTEYAYRHSSGAIMRKNIADETESELLAASAWTSVTDPYTYYISADLEYVAIAFSMTDGYAHYVRTFGLTVFETNTASEVLAIPDGVQKIKWDPTGHKVAYVQGFNVYVASNFSVTNQVTKDGKENVIFNGVSDWLYSVEITDDDALLWWSENGTYLAFARIDQNGVENFEFSLFGGTQYPKMVSFPYPKPGTPIPKTSTWIVDTDDFAVAAWEATPSTTVTDWGDYYLNSALWRSDTIFTPTWKNRFENRSVSENCDATDGVCTHVSEMESQSSTGWLGHYKPANLVQMPQINEYMTVLSNAEGFPHIVVVDTAANKKDWRTSGSFEVTDTGSGDESIFYYDSTNDWIYFTSTEVESTPGTGLPRIRHMWRVKGHGGDNTRTCITCDLNKTYQDRCNWVRPTFSPGGTYVVVNCGGTGNGVPISTLHMIDPTGSISYVRVVEENTKLLNNLEDFYFREREYGELTLPDDDSGEVYYYALHKPPNFDASRKYPMLVQVYSGPAYQYVTDKYSVDWARGYVASSDLDVVVMTFDGRGTGFRGDNIMHKVYRQLGKYEPLDQIEAARQVSNKYTYIDKDRIAIWGRSYGGYATARIIAEDASGVFRCGFSVAPVTDWMTYHTIYTERYMASPTGDNENGYNESTAIQKLENFGKHYFIIVHGTSDENVHFLNSARLSKALIDEDIDFGAYFAGDETHSFTRGRNAYGHHYKLLTNHLKICFGI